MNNTLCDNELVYCCSDFDECDATPDICSTNDNLENTHCVDSSAIEDWNPDTQGMRYKHIITTSLRHVKLPTQSLGSQTTKLVVLTFRSKKCIATRSKDLVLSPSRRNMV